MSISKIIKQEIQEYQTQTVEIAKGIQYSEYKLKNRIALFQNRHYITGKLTPTGDYEYWIDGIHHRVNNEVKNLRLDSKHIMIFSKNPVDDFPAVFTANAAMFDWMWENGKAEELNEAVEMFSALGNVLFRRTSTGYDLWDPENTYITNTRAKTIHETAIIERYEITQSELRSKKGVFKNIDYVIEHCGKKESKNQEDSSPEARTSPIYVMYRRTGEVSEEMLFEAQGKSGGDPNKFIHARIIVAGIDGDKKGTVVFAEPFKDGETMEDYFIEAHRGPYKGRWWREGLYELLIDHQIRLNDISNDIARGLQWASRVMFRHTDVMTLQNIKTSLDNGSLIKSADIQQIAVRVQGFDQLIADYNRINDEMDKISNSYEVIQGGSLPSQTPFGLGRLMDNNANKLYAFIRQKLTIPYKKVFKNWVLPMVVSDIRGKDIIKLTNNEQIIRQFREMIVNKWYLDNLVRIGPHTPEMAQEIKLAKMAEMEQFDPMIKNEKNIWKGIIPRLFVTITGENYAIEEQETIATMLQFEQDPNRRAFLLDYIYKAKGVPVPPTMQLTEQPQRGEPNLPNERATVAEPAEAMA